MRVGCSPHYPARWTIWKAIEHPKKVVWRVPYVIQNSNICPSKEEGSYAYYLRAGGSLHLMSLHLLFRNGSDLMSVYKYKVPLAPKQFFLLPPLIYLCLGLWSGLHCALECFIPMGGGHSQNMWDSSVTSF